MTSGKILLFIKYYINTLSTNVNVHVRICILSENLKKYTRNFKIDDYYI